MSNQSSADEIAKLHGLLKEGIISQQEFETVKRRIIEGSAQPYRVQARPAPVYSVDTTTRAGSMSPSGAVSNERRTSEGWRERLFTVRGRIGRKEFVLTAIGTIVLSTIGSSLLGITVSPEGEMSTSVDDSEVLVGLVLYIVAFWIQICALVKRYHDLDKSGAWLLIFLVPFVGFIFLLILIFREGTEGANMYGTRPGHTDTTTYRPPDPAYEALPNRRDIVSW